LQLAYYWGKQVLKSHKVASIENTARKSSKDGSQPRSSHDLTSRHRGS